MSRCRSLRRCLLALTAAVALCGGPSRAEDRSITVAAPAGALVQLVQDLAPIFRAQTGIDAKAVAIGTGSAQAKTDADVFVLPTRLAPAAAAESRIVLFGENVLIGLRSDRGRVRGLRDIKTAFRWIASARGLYVSSSAELGTRELELALWESVGVNVRSRSTWYVETAGDEARVFGEAAELGAYVLVERATWAAQDDRRGLEVLVSGDPVLRTAYGSYLARDGSQGGRAWQDWLSSEQGRAAIAGWRLNGIPVFTPAGDGDDRHPPRT